MNNQSYSELLFNFALDVVNNVVAFHDIGARRNLSVYAPENSAGAIVVKK